MRVIAGTHRGRPLRAPASPVTRPTADRVREAVFDVLQSVVDLDGALVLDLFAGSGAMGIEALSRGADRAVFVDDDARALVMLRANLAGLGLDARAEVVRADAETWLSRRRGAGLARFDLALCDPPYRFDAWPRLLEVLEAEVVVLESDRPLEPGARWEVLRSRRYGGTLVTVVRGAPSAPVPGSVPDGPGGPEPAPGETPEEKGTA